MEVDALAGQPGVRSARYGGDSCTSDEDRVALLLDNMKDVPWEERGARFQRVIAIAEPSGNNSSFPNPFAKAESSSCPSTKRGQERFHTLAGNESTLVTQAEGFVAGMIQYDAQGENGFGYDPVFYLPEYNQTAAQLPPSVKNQISHRAKAAEIAVEALKTLNTGS